jgi:peptidoglycan/LPS O-acetylase OafA/YrhL
MQDIASSKLRFVALDSWRGICAILVAIHNFGYPKTLFVQHSSLFVDFFFVLSGFVITHSYASKLRGTFDLLAFMMRRFGRLWPLHATMLLVFVSLDIVKFVVAGRGGPGFEVASFEAPNSFDAIVRNLFLVQSIGIHTQISWNVPSWSISTEFWTYLLFAALCVFHKGRAPSIWLMGAIAAIAAGIFFRFSTTLETNTYLTILRCIYGFSVGHLVFRIWAADRSQGNAGWPVETFAIAGVVAFVWGCEGAWSMAAPIVFGFVVWVFANETGVISKLLMIRPLVQLGAWSYSIYMTHWLVRNLLLRLTKSIGGLSVGDLGSVASLNNIGHSWTMNFIIALYIAMVLALSAFTCKFIEAPGRRYVNLMLRSSSQQRSLSTGIDR